MALQGITRRSLIALPLATAFAGRWDDPAFPDWSRRFVDRLVTDSPWARPWKGTAVQPVSEWRMISSRWSQIGMDLPPLPAPRLPRAPGTGTPPAQENTGPAVVRIEVDLIIRWASALPIRRALALQQFGRDGLDHVTAEAMLSEAPRDFVIELAGIPHMLAGRELERDLRKSRLSVPARRAVTPVSVELPPMGVHVTAKLAFPRVEGLAPDAGAIGLLVESGTLRIDEQFKLRTMIYEGRLRPALRCHRKASSITGKRQPRWESEPMSFAG